MNILLYLSVIVIWGTTWIAINLQQASGVAIPLSISYRFLLAGAVMLITLSLTRRLQRLSAVDHLFCLLQGCCVFAGNFYCFYHAVAYINSGLESVIFSMAVLFNPLNSMIFFGKRPSANTLPAALLGLSGIVLLFWQDMQAHHMANELLKGIGLSMLGTYGFSLGNMISSRHQQHHLNVLSTNSYAMGYGAVVMLIVAWLQGATPEIDWSVRYLASLGYLAIFGSVIAFSAYFILLGRIGAAAASYSTLMFPLVALTISTFYEGYHWQLSAIAGLCLILLGNLVMFSKSTTWFMFWKPRTL